jgi:hypothetical protein
LEQSSVALSLRLKGLSKKAIHYEHVPVFQENAASDSRMTSFYSARKIFLA